MGDHRQLGAWWLRSFLRYLRMSGKGSGGVREYGVREKGPAAGGGGGGGGAGGGDGARGDEVPEAALDVRGEAAARGDDVVVEEGAAGGEEVEDIAAGAERSFEVLRTNGRGPVAG